MVDPVARTDARSPSDDERLLARLAAGDERALGQLYDTYGAVVYGLAVAITQDATIAESVVTDAFAALWREARAMDSRVGSLFGWLSHTVRAMALPHRPAHAASSPSQPAAASRIAEALARLTPVERQIIELAYFGGLARADIARLLGESEATVAQAMRSAMESLRDLVATVAPASPARLVARA